MTSKVGERLKAVLDRRCQIYTTRLAEFRQAKKARPDGLHDLRVAARRFLAVTELLDGCGLASGKHLAKGPRRLLKQSSDARDLEVQARQLAEVHGIDDVVRNIQRRSQRLQRLVKASCQPEHVLPPRRAIAQVHNNIAAAPDVMLSAQILSILHQDIRQLQQTLGALKADVKARDLHALRLGIKRLRYTLETANEVEIVTTTPSWSKQLARLQDRLGNIQDLRVRRRLLKQVGLDTLRKDSKREQYRRIAAFVAKLPQLRQLLHQLNDEVAQVRQ